MVERHLHAVPVQPEVDFGSSVHPLLEDSPAIIEAAGITFTKPFEADDVVHILADPVSSIVPDLHDARNVRYGLQRLLYPNSRPIKNAGIIDPAASRALLDQRPQIKGLMEVLDHPFHHEMVRAKLHTLDPELVELVAWDEIGDMKPSRIQKYADEFGIEIDSMRVWRAKGGDRHNTVASVATMGLDKTSFVDQYIASQYRLKTTLPDRKSKFVPVEDLPTGSWVHEPGYIQLLRSLPPTTPDELGERWEALLRREDTPRHVVRAKVMWGSSPKSTRRKWIEHGQQHGGRTTRVHDYTWTSQYEHFLHESTPPVYNPVEHTVEHTSTMLGAALLAGSVDTSVLAQSFRELRTSNQSRPSYWRQNIHPERWLAAALIPMMHSPYFIARLLGTDGFRSLQALARENLED